ncbi:DHA2 family efflux MFS transporter permease subunit [Epidermidibacterium keratini]|uniref:DHA2 family efflux MFS transporter permease subunit n=1 Tax=Epidermidibacterium keratini TaxID=1891644 RepID=A0A7L4YNU1_9ACTN|nr:MFS transporter [Epidermidibacterium keratini]QHC00951.1 DHA2 family efflux MFS transporter permease subunit [Epidermidibacterium keratini]
MSDETGVSYASVTGRAVIGAAVLGSGMAMLDSTVVNVALKAIGAELDASLADLQWISNGYLLSLASLILIGGSLGDRFGRRKVFTIGVAGFAVASLLCGLAVNAQMLIAARVLQGVAGALLTPGSLAMIQGAFVPDDRPRAIGAWTGLGGVATAIGPFLGGWLVEYVSWRWVFLINLPIAVVTLIVARRVPETKNPDTVPGFDIVGAVLGTLGLAGITYALIELTSKPATAYVALAVGVLAAIGFVVNEARCPHPMMPLDLFRSKQFSGANIMTLLVYAALGAVLFFLVLQLQTVSGYAPLQAGMSTLPITAVMLLLSAQGGALAQKIGPRIPMTVGPLLCAAGVVLLSRVDENPNYILEVGLPLVVFGLGLAALVAPLTATVLAAAPDHQAGIASGINNAIARAGTLLSVAALPLIVGLSGDDYSVPSVFSAGYRNSMLICAGLLVAGGALAALTIRNPERTPTASATAA